MIFERAAASLVLARQKTEIRRPWKGEFLLRSEETPFLWWLMNKEKTRFLMDIGQICTVQPGRTQKIIGKIRVWSCRIEPLQAITEEGARAEGFASIDEFRDMWDRMHAANGAGWEANPEVIVFGFELEKKSI